MSTHKGPNVSFLVASALSNSAQGASRRFNNDMRWMLGLRSKTNTPLVDGAIHRDQAGDWTRLRAVSNPASEGSTFVNSPRPRVRYFRATDCGRSGIPVRLNRGHGSCFAVTVVKCDGDIAWPLALELRFATSSVRSWYAFPTRSIEAVLARHPPRTASTETERRRDSR